MVFLRSQQDSRGQTRPLRNVSFLCFWGGQTVSQIGSQVTSLAVPLTAALVLGATPAEMGWLTAAANAPFLVVGLFAGVLVDRFQRKPLLIAADSGRAILLGTIPLAAWSGHLSMVQLYMVSFAGGTLRVVFEVAYQSYLPALIARQHLVDANSKLEISRSAASVIGPGVGGTLVQILTAPIAVLLDALSFVVSVASLLLIRAVEPTRVRDTAPKGVAREIGEGLRAVFGNMYLRPILFCTGVTNLFSGIWGADFVLFATREIGLSPAVLGIAGATAGVGLVLGSLLARHAEHTLGVGPSIIIASLFGSGAGVLVPLAAWYNALSLPLVLVFEVIFGICLPVYNINQVSLRQAITPEHLMGRMTATIRFCVWGVVPFGALAGGWLGESVGLTTAMWVGSLGMTLSTLAVLFSPVARLRRVEEALVGGDLGVVSEAG